MAGSLWGGRFEKEMDDIVKKFNASIGFDQRMYNDDIDGSIAHVTMLGEQGIVSMEEMRSSQDLRISVRISRTGRSYSVWRTRISTWASRAG